MKTSKITCSTCHNDFFRSNAEINRNKKHNRKVYCSLNCSGKNNVSHLEKYNEPENKVLWNKGLVLTKENSPFRALVTRVRSRAKRRLMDFNLDIEYIRQLWLLQKGVCPYTGVNMILPQTSKNTNKIKGQKIFQASLDRIDCSKGYVKGNIQIVSLMSNISKNEFIEQDFLLFCTNVASFDKEQFSDDYYKTHTIKAFKIFINFARKRSKDKGIKDYYEGLTIEYLQELWIKQKGTCPYTGWRLDLPQSGTEWNNYEYHIKRASLDRIDNSKGYIPGNVQFVSLIYNFTKGRFTDQDVQTFCKAVYNYRLS